MNSGDLHFENYRRERKRRRLDAGPVRHLGKQAAVLRELEEAENREIRNQQLTREVQEFFEEATRTAASIVSQVAESAEEQLQQTVAAEMSEFLTATIRRAQEFVMMVQGAARNGVANTELTANLQNIVGAKLDGFRFEGDARTAEHHVGQDPFANGDAPRGRDDGDADDDDADHRAAEPPAKRAHLRTSPQTAVPPRPSPVEEHLVAEYVGGGEPDDGDAPSRLEAWVDGLAADDARLRVALKALVQVGAMQRDEAREIYAELRGERS